VANVMKDRDRKSVFISTKLIVKEDKSKEGFLKRARKCLEELNMEYVDCLMMHSAETVESLSIEGFHAAMDELKTEGRIRHVGVSNHGSFWFKDPEETMAKVLLAAAEDGRFDVFLLAYNFLQMDQAEEVLKTAHKKNIGTALMKTTPVALYHSMKSYVERMEKEGKEIDPLYTEGVKRYQDKYDRARTYEDMEGFLSLSGTKLTKPDQAKLDAYREGCGELYCRHACGKCEPQCPHGVPVNTIMRYHHYFIAQGREKEAMLKYAKIPGVKADVCGSCALHPRKNMCYNFKDNQLLTIQSLGGSNDRRFPKQSWWRRKTNISPEGSIQKNELSRTRAIRRRGYYSRYQRRWIEPSAEQGIFSRNNS
jgi:predicted aldo/keto reductase-like oxidoreductase